MKAASISLLEVELVFKLKLLPPPMFKSAVDTLWSTPWQLPAGAMSPKCKVCSKKRLAAEGEPLGKEH